MLRVVEGPAAGTELDLDGELVLGRAEGGPASLQDDPELSRRHARVYSPDGERYVLEDLGSTNGTYLNGWRIPTPQALNTGDRIQLGANVLEVASLTVDARPATGGTAGWTIVTPIGAPEAPSGPVLEAHGVEKSYGELTVLRGVDLEIQPGEIVGLLGPNGAGKTSFVSIVAGLRQADAGEVRVSGVDALRNSGEARRKLGLAPQDLGVYATLTVRRNLEFFGEMNGLLGAELSQRVEEVGEALSLTPKFGALAGTLSGGQQRRLHTGMALLHKPALCILDEPTVGADVRTRHEILELVKHLAEEGHAVCYSTHYLPEIEELGATVAILEGGRIIARGLIAELIAQHGQQALELRFDGPAPALELDDLGELGADVSVEDSVVRIMTPDPPRAAAAMMARLGPAALRLKEVEMIRPSLESVYLALTERRYSEEREVSSDPSLAGLPPPEPQGLIAAAAR